MRKLIMTAVLACLLTVPVVAQFGFFGGGGMAGPSLLAVPDVQKELKLTDEQTKAITSARDKMREAFSEGREAAAKAREEYTKELKKVYDGLKADQKSRLLGIEIQLAERGKTPQLFGREDVQKALKFTAKQKDTAKESLTELEKDTKEIRDDAKGDFSKLRETFQKIQKLNGETYEKITKTFSDDQKKALKDMQGEKFELKLGFGKDKGKGKGFGKKDKGKKKTDDF